MKARIHQSAEITVSITLSLADWILVRDALKAIPGTDQAWLLPSRLTNMIDKFNLDLGDYETDQLEAK